MFDWSKQIVLITGGTGSFGQAFTRFLLEKNTPKTIRIFSRDEYKQHIMQQELGENERLRFFIGDVRDRNRVFRAMQDVTLVIHAAALKQIVACEYNPTEAIDTNINGTRNVIDAAIESGVGRVFGLITDKAVSPINLYGATKLCAEKLLIQSNVYVGKGKTRISAVRYGNVAGSRGSVIPLFQKRLEEKKFIPITHPEMTRFWITLSQGVAFVAKTIEQMNGGEIFIPKMPSFKVVDLASALDETAQFKTVGIRTGEKLHEDLITIHEARNVHEFKDYYRIIPEFDFWDDAIYQKDGKSVKKDFSYNSGTNSHFLSKEQLRKYIQKG